MNFPVGTDPFSVAVGDFNGDGKQDLAVANWNSDNVSILLGTGTGGFGSCDEFCRGGCRSQSRWGISTGMGSRIWRWRILVATTFRFFWAPGQGALVLRRILPWGTQPFSVAVGDFNGDGKQDLAVANDDFSDNVSILLNGFLAARADRCR